MSNTKNIVTPQGTLNWVNVFGKGAEQDNGSRRYTASIILENDSDELKAVQKEINDFWKANKPEGAKQPKSFGIKKMRNDEGEETGVSLVTFWTSAVYPDGNTKDIPLRDKDNNDLTLEKGKGIGNKSVGRVSGFMKIYKKGTSVGITLYLKGVQVIELEEFEFENNEDLGFN